MKEIIPVCVTHASNKTPGFTRRDKKKTKKQQKTLLDLHFTFLLNIHEALLTLAYFLFGWAYFLNITCIPLEILCFRF